MTAIANVFQPVGERSTTICPSCGGTGWVRLEPESEPGSIIVRRCLVCNASRQDVQYALETFRTPVNDGRYTIMLVKK